MAAEASRLGSTLGARYRVDELIGRGGMSTVYRGFDLQLHRVVAIKIFQHDEDDGEQRWESEVRLLSQLNDPHLVTLHDAHLGPVGEGDSYLIMEYVPGSSLQQHLAENGPSAVLAALVVAQIGEALASVHARGIIHRDLKPGNILVEPTELPPVFLRTKLADFGIAHLLGSDRLTRTGTMVGTAAYASPEQLTGETATPASDVYSLGLVAIECLTGRSVFPGTPSESLMARLTRDPVLPEGLPSAWATLLASMTTRDPALRPTAINVSLRSRELEPLDVVAQAETTVMGSESGAPTERMLPPTLALPAAGSPVAGSGKRSRRPVIFAAAAVSAALILGAIVLAHLPEGTAAPSVSSSATPTQAANFPATSPAATTAAPGNAHGHGKGNGNGKNG